MTLQAARWRQRLTPGWLLRTLLASRGTIQTPLGPEWQQDLAAIRETRALVPLLMSDACALQILTCARAARGLNGVMAEAGVLMGGSARLICEAKADVPVHLFDVFEGLHLAAPRSEAEADVQAHFGPVHGSREAVERLLAPYAGVHIHPGFFPQSAAGLGDVLFSFVHLDLDLPPSTRLALEYFHPRMVAGGMLIGDDYTDRGVRKTFDDFFADRNDTVIELPWGQVMIVKQGNGERADRP